LSTNEIPAEDRDAFVAEAQKWLRIHQPEPRRSTRAAAPERRAWPTLRKPA